jgi:hypothetical protein
MTFDVVGNVAPQSHVSKLSHHNISSFTVFLAQVGRNAKRHDNEDWRGPKDEHAVVADDAPIS